MREVRMTPNLRRRGTLAIVAGLLLLAGAYRMGWDAFTWGTSWVLIAPGIVLVTAGLIYRGTDAPPRPVSGGRPRIYDQDNDRGGRGWPARKK